jgi:hypothetical protein
MRRQCQGFEKFDGQAMAAAVAEQGGIQENRIVVGGGKPGTPPVL